MFIFSCVSLFSFFYFPLFQHVMFFACFFFICFLVFLNVFLPFIIVIIIIIYLVYSFLVLMFLFWHVQSSYFLSLMFFFVSRSCFTVRILSRIKDIIKHEYNNAKKPKQKIVCELNDKLLYFKWSRPWHFKTAETVSVPGRKARW